MESVNTAGPAERAVFPDLARAAALVGIGVVNVAVFSYSMTGGYGATGRLGDLDYWAYFGVNALFFLKSYTIFAFMFGVGFAFQIEAAMRHGAGFAGRYWRRIIGLLVLGLLHVALLFPGDILVVYALLGSILFLFRHSPPATLVRRSVAAYLMQILAIGCGVVFVGVGARYAPEMLAAEVQVNAEIAATADAAYGAGSFADAVRQRFVEWQTIMTWGVLMEGIGAFAFFLLGFAAERTGAIRDPRHPVWRHCRRIALPIGLAGGVIGASVMSSTESVVSMSAVVGTLLITLFSPFSSMGYLGLIALWAQRPQGTFSTFVARGGSASLTAYLLQSLIFSLIFNNYGFGLYKSIPPAVAIALGLIVGGVSLVLTSLWRTRFSRGPMEWLLRYWTYFGTPAKPPTRDATSTA